MNKTIYDYITKKEPFRSKKLINTPDDMIRLTIEIPQRELVRIQHETIQSNDEMILAEIKKTTAKIKGLRTQMDDLINSSKTVAAQFVTFNGCQCLSNGCIDQGDCKGKCGCKVCHDAYQDYLSDRD